MKERPISFSAPMVRAILDGKKTMTRRPVKGLCGDVVYHDLCSYGKTGDRLWVREPFNGIDPWKPSQRMPREANLSRANLCCSLGSIFSDCCWPGHGEFGRRLLAVRIAGDDVYFCGCFLGSLDNLREYIAKGDEQYRQSRTVAADFVAARMAEMGWTE